MNYYKVLTANGISANGGCTVYSLPSSKRKPGDWMPRIYAIELERGYSLCRRQDLVVWLHDSIYEVEVKPEAYFKEKINRVITSGPLRLLRRLPWDARVARLFACDCAEHVLYLCDDEDPLFRQAIETSRRYAAGAATREELDAVRHAAWRAAKEIEWSADDRAAGVAARAAAWAARDPKWDDAGTAARAAVAAAGAAACDTSGPYCEESPGPAAELSEQKWQTNKLFEYLTDTAADPGEGRR